MADVRITFSPDRAAAAERLRDAIAAEGYQVASEPINDVEELLAGEEGQQSAAATLLIWSRPLVLSALQPGLLRKLRQQSKLIEVSPDGVGPQAKDGDSQAILISGWRGQPFHPGWQRIASELERLCGPPTETPEPTVAAARPEPAPAPQPLPAETREKDRPSRTWAWPLALLAAVGLFGAGFGASTWIGSRESKPEQPPPAQMQSKQPEQLPVARTPATPDLAKPARPAPPQPSGLASSGSSTGQPPVSQASATAPAATGGASKKASRKEKQSASRSTKARSPAARETKRYSRKNSEVMRLFCEGSGRSTPQCKEFLRSVRRSRR